MEKRGAARLDLNRLRSEVLSVCPSEEVSVTVEEEDTDVDDVLDHWPEI